MRRRRTGADAVRGGHGARVDPLRRQPRHGDRNRGRAGVHRAAGNATVARHAPRGEPRDGRSVPRAGHVGNGQRPRSGSGREGRHREVSRRGGHSRRCHRVARGRRQAGAVTVDRGDREGERLTVGDVRDRLGRCRRVERLRPERRRAFPRRDLVARDRPSVRECGRGPVNSRRVVAGVRSDRRRRARPSERDHGVRRRRRGARARPISCRHREGVVNARRDVEVQARLPFRERAEPVTEPGRDILRLAARRTR